MDILVIDDNEQFASSLCTRLSVVHGLSCQRIVLDSADDVNLSGLIKTPVPQGCVIFINVNLRTASGGRQRHKGVELLTWLRIRGVMNHCVLYSFERVGQLPKRDRKNLLIFSKGITFIQLPRNLSTIKFGLIKDDTADKENLKAYLRSVFDVTKFRHRDANWWSMKVMWDVHRIAQAGDFHDEYPQHVKDNISKLNNAVGVFLNELEVVNISKKIEDALHPFLTKKEELAGLLLLYDKRAKSGISVDDYYSMITSIKAELSVLSADIQHMVGQSDYKDCLVKKQQLQNDLTFAMAEVRDIEAAEIESGKIADEIKRHETTLSNIYVKEKRRLFASRESSPVDRVMNILLIDDQAENGWEVVFKTLFKNAEIKPVVPQKEYAKDIDALYERQVKDPLDELDAAQGPSIVLLDLRLFDETERSIEIRNVSGRLLLEKIRKDFRGIPVLITTASNKVWTFQELFRIGADAYWVKEGLDEQRTAEDSVENYSQLLFLVDKMTDGRYVVLKEFATFAENFEQGAKKHWSKSFTWLNKNHTHGDVKAISRSLNDAVLVLKNYLHNYHLGYGFKDGPNESFVLSGLINKICGVYECVHVADKYTNHTTYEVRGDYALDTIKDLRNKYSHWSYQNATWDVLVRCIEETKKYLDVPPF